MADEIPAAKFEVGEEVKGAGLALVVQSRKLKAGIWVYVCVPVNAEIKIKALPYPERMLTKDTPPVTGRSIHSKS